MEGSPIKIKKIIVLFILTWLISFFIGCSQPVLLNGIKIYTEDNKPVENALVYVEIWGNNRPVDFVFAVTGKDGRVPPNPIVPIPIKRNQIAFVAAFASGYECNIMPRAIVYGKYQIGELFLEKMDNGEQIVCLNIGTMEFPFENYSKLKEKLKNSDYKPLVKTWLTIFNYNYDKYEAMPLYLQERFPDLETTIKELKKAHAIK